MMRGGVRTGQGRWRARAALLPGLLLPVAATPAQQVALPAGAGQPMAIDRAADPVLSLADTTLPRLAFIATIGNAVRRNPSLEESKASRDQAAAQLAGVRESRLPSVDINFTAFRVFSRDFSNDPQNILERTRPSRRTDATLSLNQVLFDFGAGADREAAARSRVKATLADIDSSASQIALDLVVSWYEVAAYRTLATLAKSFLESEAGARGAVQSRIDAGVAAPVDLARVDSAIARNRARLADFERRTAAAEARFQALAGRAPPSGLQRVPAACPTRGGRDAAIAAAGRAPPVRSAEAVAFAAERDARAVKREARPVLTAGIDAGRYGLIETPFDYDVRGRLGLRIRLFGGAEARIAEAGARARAAGARARQVRNDAVRDAATAWSDVDALGDQLAALETAYLTARTTRDAVAERFRVQRGTIFDVINGEEELYQSAVSYLQGLSELDTNRYVLLARTGALLDCLQLDLARGDGVE